MRRFLALLLTWFAAAASSAATLAPAARVEIEVLLSRLEVSACDFNRNGSWYQAAQAKAHLLNKLKYLEDRGLVQSAEQFIELGASSSSISGQAYLVRCSGGAAVASRSWLGSQLQLVRSAAGASKAP
ncbi:MAG: DUF5329 family protein [Rhodoferax sp.]